ncbi:two-component system phosphate regulon sensor histidine kinase PhoR [Bradyrhizobium sp. S3.12.5]|uniref:sensor histidine kinase n=1 Tax=Bradyrhizobium sp. S3.12.5 TaxID=3156386 RepID=UPI003393346D
MNGTGSGIGTVEWEEEPSAAGIVLNQAVRTASSDARTHVNATLLLRMTGEELLRSVEVIQSAHEHFNFGVRTTSEQRWLQCSKRAIDRFKEQLEQIQIALQVHDRARLLELKPVCVHEVLRRACREYEHAALSKGICMHVVASNDLIISDALLLGAALRNLVSNAIRYTEPGGRILIGCRRSGAYIRIDVYDTGVGIPGEQIPKIFDAFTRLSPQRCEGFGVGLFIVRQALGILGHRIDVASTPRRGSRFSIFVMRAGGAAGRRQ